VNFNDYTASEKIIIINLVALFQNLSEPKVCVGLCPLLLGVGYFTLIVVDEGGGYFVKCCPLISILKS
jgi:hypothetical protein